MSSSHHNIIDLFFSHNAQPALEKKASRACCAQCSSPQMNVTLHWNPGSWLTLLNASQQVRTLEKRGVSLSGKAVGYGINLIALVHHYYQSPRRGRGCKRDEEEGRSGKRWSCEKNKADRRKQTQINQDIFWGGVKTREMRQSLRFWVKRLGQMPLQKHF